MLILFHYPATLAAARKVTMQDYEKERYLCSETLELLKSNDPSLTNLVISWDTEGCVGSDENSLDGTEQLHFITKFDFAHMVDWKMAGPLLGENTHLRKLSVTNFTWMGLEYSCRDTYRRCMDG